MEIKENKRDIEKDIQKLVEDQVSEEILKKTVEPGDKILIDAVDGKIVVRKA